MMARIPAKIGKYNISNKVAEGGMGAVYKGVHPTLNKEVILKKLTLSDDEHIIERFKREARIMMDFKNDNIVDVYDHFKAGGSYYIVLEFVDGIALDELIKQERYLSNDTALLIFLEACKALKYAHDKNVIHRDIKPGNILISKEGEIKLVDFGIAAISDDDETNLTRDGMTLGTPSYMAPEQFNNSKSVDKRADIYSMGVMLYEMVTGKKPYPGNYSPETLAKIQKGKYLSPRKHNPAINNRTLKLIRKCMKSKADRRYKDLQYVISVLEKYFGKKNRENTRKVLVGKITGESVLSPSQKKPVLKKIFLIFLLFLIIGAGVYGLYWSGFYHQILSSKTYGALKVQVKIPRGEKESQDLFIKAYLFMDDDDEIPSVDEKFTFRIKEETETFYILESNTVYQPAGDYRVKVKCEEELFWASFYLDSVDNTSQLSGGSKIQVEDFESVSRSPAALAVKSRVYDLSTGEELVEGVERLLFEGGEWIPLGEEKNPLQSASIYRIRFEKENYHPKEFSLKIDVYQALLNLDVELEPIAGSLGFKANAKGFELEILSDLTGWLPLRYSLEEERQIITLYPGDYTLRFTGKKLIEEIPLSIDHTSEIQTSLLYDKEKKSLTIEGITNE